MGVDTMDEGPNMISSKEFKRVSRTVCNLLSAATLEKRITCGLRPAIQALENDPNKILFCVMPHTEDSAKHIHSVLMQAFCYEHHITIIKVDSIEKLKNIVGAPDCSCVLIHRRIDNSLRLEMDLERMLHSVEDRCMSQPVFKLPAK